MCAAVPLRAQQTTERVPRGVTARAPPAAMLAGGVAVRGCAFGMGVFADGGARKGEVCFTEVPFAVVQTLASRCRAPACAHCLSPLGPLAAAVVAATCTGRRVAAVMSHVSA